MSRIITFTLITLLCAVSCQTSIAVDHIKEIEAIKAASKAFSQAYVEGDLKKQMSFYTIDVVNIVGSQRIIEGKTAVTKYWTLPKTRRILEHKSIPQRIVVEGNTAFDYGIYQGKAVNNRDTSSFTGQYLITWRKVADHWKMSSDMWASKR